ncbi:MAG: glycosyltransferase family 9 protein, partial [Candidatus Omnitrophica bacterium]|nr:glycosyltransferase family 9 protein [Candidatus Omnitrophota bacterium]
PHGALHRADQILALAGSVGITRADGTYEYFLTAEDEEKSNTILHEAGGGSGRIIGFNIGGNWRPKKWPRENFLAVAVNLLNRFQDIEIMITGAAKDIKDAKSLANSANSPRCYSVAGETTLNELAALFKKCELVISADSGPLHLASATGVTTVGLFGPTSYKITGPRGVGKNIVVHKEVGCKIPCYSEKCDNDYECMKAITVDEVVDAVSKELAENIRA